MHSVLDLDLDFFVWPIALDIEEDGQRLDPKEYFPNSEKQVRSFLEERCGLSTVHRIPGRFLVHHVDAFTVWREWLEEHILSNPFNVVHVDAHADLGSGWQNESPRFFETELLKLPVEQRSFPRFGVDAVNSGNYLVAAVANQWINQLTYVYPIDPNPPSPAVLRERERMERIQKLHEDGTDGDYPPDLPVYCFQDGDPNTRKLLLKEYPALGHSDVKFDTTPIHFEPKVPFSWLEAEMFKYSGFTHMVIAQSPNYTPNTADPLLDIISEYVTTA
jgi:hypothetical protein